MRPDLMLIDQLGEPASETYPVDQGLTVAEALAVILAKNGLFIPQCVIDEVKLRHGEKEEAAGDLVMSIIQGYNGLVLEEELIAEESNRRPEVFGLLCRTDSNNLSRSLALGLIRVGSKGYLRAAQVAVGVGVILVEGKFDYEKACGYWPSAGGKN